MAQAEKKSINLKFNPEGTDEMKKGRKTEYEVKPNEQGHVHVELEKTQFDSGAGLKVSAPFVQCFDTRAWRQFAPNAKGLGYKYIKVLYAPKGVDKTIPAPKKVNK